MAGLQLGAGLDLEATIGKRLDRLDSRIGRLTREMTRPESAPLVGSILGITNQVAAATIVGPEGGFEFHVRRLSFAPQLNAGALVAVPTPGTLIVGKSSGLLTQSQGSGQAVAASSNFIEISRTQTVPNTLLFSNTQCVIRYPFNIVILWASGSAVTLVIDGDAVCVPIGAGRETEN